MYLLRYTFLFSTTVLCMAQEQPSEHPNLWNLIKKLKSGTTPNKKETRTLNFDNLRVGDSKISGNRNYIENQILKYFYMNNKKRDGEKNLSGSLGRPCKTDINCESLPGHVCVKEECQCHPKFVQINSTSCLPGVLLGFSCEDHAQCRMRVPGSSCIQGFCRCGAGFVPYRRANCITASMLGESCRTHAQCLLGTEGSKCKWVVKNVMGNCQCKPDMPRRGKKCGPSGFALGAPCGKSYDCVQHIPGSICVGVDEVSESRNKSSRGPVGGSFPSRTSEFEVGIQYPVEGDSKMSLEGRCQCPKGHLAIKNGTRCVSVQKEIGVSPISLGKPCIFSSQCKSSDPYSFCNNGLCDCVARTPQCSASNTGCHNETFQCFSDGECLSANFVCDGKRDCHDGSDESMCIPGRCSSLSFTCKDGTCIGRGLVCDSKMDCPDGSDEFRCDARHNGGECPETTFRCHDGQCLPGYGFCNALASCRDESDEDIKTCVGGVLRVPYCPFRCKNGRCRSMAIVCSGTDGCGDNSDEENCSVCNCPKP